MWTSVFPARLERLPEKLLSVDGSAMLPAILLATLLDTAGNIDRWGCPFITVRGPTHGRMLITEFCTA